MRPGRSPLGQPHRGFTGIAQRMAQIQGAIGQLQGQLAHVGQLVNEARRPVSRAPDQMSPEDTIKVLGPVREQVGTIHGALGATIAKVGEIQQQTAGALQGGQPGPMLGRLDVALSLEPGRNLVALPGDELLDAVARVVVVHLPRRRLHEVSRGSQQRPG